VHHLRLGLEAHLDHVNLPGEHDPNESLLVRDGPPAGGGGGGLPHQLAVGEREQRADLQDEPQVGLGVPVPVTAGQYDINKLYVRFCFIKYNIYYNINIISRLIIPFDIHIIYV
jgi:hypothetical protein